MIQQADALCQRCLQTDSPDDCEALDQTVHQVDALAREAMQALLFRDLGKIADKLESGVALTPDEEKHVELVVIGNAAHYVEEENNVADWKKEVRRLIGELRAASGGSP